MATSSKPDPKKKDIFTEWECPECTAHNPFDQGFTIGDDLFCVYCGSVFLVKKVDTDEKYKLVMQ
jgi:DNA-directed RNA polymerase subunit RPC12/RpoP